jgi:hypothetical protein
MFKTFRNFPRKKDPANTIPQETINTFVIDAINDTSGGVWISPTRNTTTDDGTLHIGLMNPFGGAQTTIVDLGGGGGGGPCLIAENPQSEACINACNICDCETTRVAVNVENGKIGGPQFSNAQCIIDTDNGTVCTLKCRLSTGGFPAIFFDAPCSGESQYNCDPNSGGPPPPPPHETSNILRAIERFILDLDITEIQNIDPNTISSAILRLPIKSKRDWM